MTDAAQSVVLELFATALSPAHDLGAVDRLLSADFADRSAPAGDDDRASVVTKLSGLWSAVPEGWYEIVQVVSDGSLVAVRSILRGGSRPVDFADFYRVVDGLIIEHWHVVDAAVLTAALRPAAAEEAE